jgi:hypothetical protein
VSTEHPEPRSSLSAQMPAVVVPRDKLEIDCAHAAVVIFDLEANIGKDKAVAFYMQTMRIGHDLICT